MKLLILLAVLCVFAAARVPRERRAMEDDTDSTPATDEKPICEQKTPCGWVFYKESIDFAHENWERSNDYCICATNQTCAEDENDAIAKSIVKRCKNQTTS